jgi:hypothetical protein
MHHSLAPELLIKTLCSSVHSDNRAFTGAVSLALLATYALLLLIVFVNMLIAIVSETFSEVKRIEHLQIIRNMAGWLCEAENRYADSSFSDLTHEQLLHDCNSRIGCFIHVLVPAAADAARRTPQQKPECASSQQVSSLRQEVAELRQLLGAQSQMMQQLLERLAQPER